MPLIDLIIAIVIIGVVLWLINSYITMDPKVKKILNVAVIAILIIWLLSVTGILARLNSVRVPSVAR